MATEILTGGMNLAFARSGPRWKKMRKAANLALSATAAELYAHLQEREAQCFIYGLLTSQEDVDKHIRR